MGKNIFFSTGPPETFGKLGGAYYVIGLESAN